MRATAACNLAPVVDGRTLPGQSFRSGGSAISANVPLMIGSTETEVTWNASMTFDPIDDAASARAREEDRAKWMTPRRIG